MTLGQKMEMVHSYLNSDVCRNSLIQEIGFTGFIEIDKDQTTVTAQGITGQRVWKLDEMLLVIATLKRVEKNKLKH